MESFVKARIDSDIKAKAEINLQKMGLSMSTAIRALVYIIANEGKIPFTIKTLNEETLETSNDIESIKQSL